MRWLKNWLNCAVFWEICQPGCVVAGCQKPEKLRPHTPAAGSAFILPSKFPPHSGSTQGLHVLEIEQPS